MKKYNLGIEATLDILGGKWKALIICLLMSGPKRTGELQRLIPGISQKVLIQQLKELEKDDIVIRVAYNQLPPKVEYFIIDYGRTANQIINLMCIWGKDNIKRRREKGEDVLLLEEDDDKQMQLWKKSGINGRQET
ncbi:winged helix-turn-helix transcriptional regulator [Streptococcus dentiloxodontae]